MIRKARTRTKEVHPSSGAPAARPAHALRDLHEALIKFGPASDDLSEEDVSRVEAKILVRGLPELEGLPREAPVLEGPASFGTLQAFQPSDDEAWFTPKDAGNTRPSVRARRGGAELMLGALEALRRAADAHRRVALVAIVSMSLLLGLAIGMSPRAGTRLGSLRAIVEWTRISLATGPLDKADVLMDIAEDRLLRLSHVSGSDVPSLAAQMDMAGLRALELVVSAPEGHDRTDALGRLLALGYSQTTRLESWLKTARGTEARALGESLAAARKMVAVAVKMLSPTATLTDPVTLTFETDEPSGRSDGLRRTRRRGAAEATSQERPAGAGGTAPDPSTQEPDPQEPSACDPLQGQICINLPVRLP